MLACGTTASQWPWYGWNMSITERLRKDLQAVIEQAEAGDTAEVVRTARKALRELDANRLLTTTNVHVAV